MVRYPPEKKPETRRRILDAASRAFRTRGPDGVTVQEIMAEAELTVGGFYRHFQSKDELFREALDRALGATRGIVRKGPSGSGTAWVDAAAATYLSTWHLRQPSEGCPLPSLGAEVARGDEATRGLFGERLSEIAELISERIDPGAPEAARAEAWGLLSTLVGALLLARGVRDDDLAEEILAAGRSAVRRRSGPGASARSGSESSV